MILIRVKNEEERSFYEIETDKNNWSVRELERQINTSLFERLTLSKDKKSISKLAEKGQQLEKAINIIPPLVRANRYIIMVGAKMKQKQE